MRYEYIVKRTMPKKTKPRAISHWACPNCGEVDADNIIYIRCGFYECRTCKHKFLTQELP